ncbi:MAG: LPS export ABC transporter ATP-binding protein [Bacteroidales bacterium]|nr:LPS export ABC transporter ATP-binding protein [Bacteroidales bacterium]
MELRTEKVVKKYKSRTVVKEVSVSVKQGEIVGLLGPNGAGKTTTFYMIVGIIRPNGGKVFFDDMEITDMPMYRRAQMGVGYLAQEASVFRQMSVADNIMSILEFRKDLDKKQRQEKLESLLNEFGLQKIRESKGIQLSGGERRRTEIARALANDPKFLLLDEPFAGVDPIAVQDIQDIVAHLKDKNIGILITDHNVNETLRITDRAYLLYEGTVLHEGRPEEMANDPEVREKYLGRDFEWRGKKQTKKLEENQE